MSFFEVLLLPFSPFRWVWRAWMTALTELRILRSLRAQGSVLGLVTSDLVSNGTDLLETTDLICPRLILRCTGFNRYVDAVQGNLEIVLEHLNQRHVLFRNPVRLSAEPFRLERVAIRWRGTRYARMRGEAVLHIRIGDRDLASFPLRLLSTQDVVAGLRVTKLRLDAQFRDGRTSPMPGRIVAEELISIAPSFEIESGVVSPASGVPGRFLIRQGERILAGFAFQVRLDSRCIEFRTRRVAAPAGIAPEPPLEVLVEVAGALAFRQRIRVLTSKPITSVEGSLSDAMQMPITR